MTFGGIYWTGVPRTTLTVTFNLTTDRLIDDQLHSFDDGNSGGTYLDKAQPVLVLSECQPVQLQGYLVWYWKFYKAVTNSSIPTSGGVHGGVAYTSGRLRLIMSVCNKKGWSQ